MTAFISLGMENLVATELAFRELGIRMQSFREPLERSVKDVIIPAISENFATEGHGTWPKLAPTTVENKSRNGFPSRMLVRTKAMIIAATQQNTWEYGSDRSSATLNVNKLPFYADYHIYGTSKMPRRDFTAVGEKEITEVKEVFSLAIQARIQRFYGV